MEWSEEYETGHDQIDQQHKALFESTEDFREVVAAGHGEKAYPGFLEFLIAYAQAHFEFEEEYLRASKSPKAKENKIQHDRFMSLIKEGEEIRRKQGFDLDRVTELLDRIDDWFVVHIVQAARILRKEG